MEHSRLRKPALSQSERTRPSDRVFLASTAECTPPMPEHSIPEFAETVEVPRLATPKSTLASWIAYSGTISKTYMHEAIDTSLPHGEMGISTLSCPIADGNIVTWVTPA